MSIFRDNLFAGRVAVVTGGGTGIGRGIAEGLARHGADLAIVSRKSENVEPAARQIATETGRRCLAIVADVRQADAVEAAVARTVAELGGLDIVVNNAAGNFFCPSADLSPNGFGVVLDIDAKGTWNVSRAAYLARLRDHGGQILNISATLHHGGTPGQLHVAAAKAAVDAMTRTLAVEWGPSGIRVNAIAPGPIGDTEGARRLLPGDRGERLRGSIPTRRLGTIDDIVQLTLFVLSDAASNINGAIMISDGGLSLLGRFGLDEASVAGSDVAATGFTVLPALILRWKDAEGPLWARSNHRSRVRRRAPMQTNDRAFERAMALAALSGLKVTFGPALLATSRRWPSRQNWVMAAIGEMFLDKLGVLPPRYRPALLVSRSLMGAWVARESLREDGEDDPWVSVAGGMVAAGTAVAAPLARMAIHKVLGVPDALLGVAEDYMALSCGSQVLEMPMHEITGAAREMFEDARDRARPMLEPMGLDT